MEFLRFLEGVRTPTAAAIFQVITYLGEEVFLLGIICALYWCANKKLAYRLAFSYFTAGLVVQGLKITFRIPRPWVRDTAFMPVESALEKATGYSFPSGHTQSATTMFGTFALNTKKWGIRVIMIICIALVMLSRMYLGVHTPADVIAAVIISGILVVAVHKIAGRLVMTEKRRIIIAILLFIAALAVMIYSLCIYNSGIIDQKSVSDCCKASAAGIGFALSWYIESRFIKFDEKAASTVLQICKFLIGIVGALAIKTGLKVVIGDSLPADMFRYFLLVVWAMVLFPIIIKKWFGTQKE